MGAFTIPSIFTAVDKYSSVVKTMQKNTHSFATKASAGVDRLDRRLRKLTPSLGGVQRQLLAFASAGILIAGVGAAVNTVKDFEQANANLASVMSTTIEANKTLAIDAERLGSITAKSATEVVSLQESYARLGFSQNEIVDVTEATINGSIAMNAELADTAELTGAMIRTFKDFSSADAPEILDQLTLATQKSALNFEKLSTALPIVSGAANQAGIPFNKMLALLGKLSDAGIDASSSSTALRNIFLDSAKKGKNYEEILQEIVRQKDKLTASFDEFGKRGAVSASILAENIEKTQELSDILGTAAKGHKLEGVASRTAATQLDTLQGSLTLLSSAYEGLLIRMNNGSGALGVFRKLIDFTTKNIEKIATVIGVLVAGFLALKTILIISKIAIFAYNVAVGIAAVSSSTLAVGVGASNVAMVAQKVATWAVIIATEAFTAAQWILNIALNANPIGLIIIGIAALIALIVVIINKYDEWGAALTIILGPLGMIINLIQSFRRNWDMITDAFANGGILAGFKAIGVVILDSVLMPLQQILELIEKVPGLDFGFSEDIKSFRAGLGVDVDATTNGEAVIAGGDAELVNNKRNEQEGLVDKITETKNSNLNININDPGGNATIEGDTPAIGVNISSTSGF